MHQEILADAAISLSTILTAHSLPHAFFGGFAILEVCRTAASTTTSTTSKSTSTAPYRQSKDIDCLVLSTKETVLALLANYPAYIEIPQNREDYVAFFWKHPSSSSGTTVLVELFVSKSPSTTPTKSTALKTHAHNLATELYGPTTLPLLEIPSLFTGKLHACATRSKETDFIDLLFLISLFPAQIKASSSSSSSSSSKHHSKKISKKVIRDVLARWPGLRGVLESVGVSEGTRVRSRSREMMRRRFEALEGCVSRVGGNVAGGNGGGGLARSESRASDRSERSERSGRSGRGTGGDERGGGCIQARRVEEGEVQRGLGWVY